MKQKHPGANLGKFLHRAATNTSPKKTQTKRGTGKGQTLFGSHKAGGAINAPRKARSPLDSRGASRVAKSMRSKY